MSIGTLGRKPARARAAGRVVAILLTAWLAPGSFAQQQHPAAGEPPAVHLAEAGGEPRHVLRYQFKDGAVERMVMTMDMQMDMAVNGQPMPETRLPVWQVTTVSEVQDVLADGSAKLAFRFENAKVLDSEGVQPAVLEAMRSAVGELTRLSGSATVSPRGLVESSRIDGADASNPQMAQMVEAMEQSIEQMTTPLPEQAVGQGAIWKALQTIDQQGMIIHQTVEMQLVQVEPHQATAAMKLTQSAPKQEISAPNVPPEVTIVLERMMGEGEGLVTLDLSQLTPTSNVSAMSLMDMQLEMHGQQQDMTMELSVDVSIAPE